MAEELPDFEKCCVCWPLLTCLYLWSGVKMVVYVFLIPVVGMFMLFAYVIVCFGFGDGIYEFLCCILIISLFFLLITDFIATLVFICKEDNVKWFRGYYRYNIGLSIVMILWFMAAVATRLAKWGDSHFNEVACLAASITIIVLQAYFTMLLRSLIIKLESSPECRPIRE